MDSALLLSLTSGAVIYLLIQLFGTIASPLRKVPGPFLARFTRLWYLYRLKLGRVEHDLIALHQKYKSTLIRYGPNHYSISDPEALKKIYPHSNGPEKSAWYGAFSVPGTFSIFTQPSEITHRTWRRAYGDMYSMSSMTGYEALADDCIKLFCERLREHSLANKPVDLAWWFQCYAADTVAAITYRRRFGYLDAGKDTRGILTKVHQNLNYAAGMGVYHEWHWYVFELKELLRKIGIGEGNPRGELGKWSAKGVAERREMRKAIGTRSSQDGPVAVLDRFLDANDADPLSFPEGRIHDGVMSNIVAGSDTTAMTLCAAIYYLLRNPESLSKLRGEVDEAHQQSALSTPPTFKESNSLKYLQAVIQETLRMHPAVGLPLERIVPAGGLDIDGYHFPAGTIVGANAWVVHQDASIFGPEPDRFKPERWLEADREQLNYMNRNLMAFGVGSRVCLGKNISMLEMSKVLPELVRRFDMDFATENFRNCGWETKNSWFVIVKELPVVFKLRVA